MVRSVGVLWVVVIALCGWLIVGRDGGVETTRGGSQSRLQEINERGVLRVGYVVNRGQVDEASVDHTLSGFYVELIERIAGAMEVELAYEPTTFSAMIAGLSSGRFDVVIGGGYTSIERATMASFTQPVMYVPLGIVTRRDDKRFKTIDDLNAPDVRIAATAGGASADYLRQEFPRAKPIILVQKGLDAVVLEVSSGRADAGIGNAGNCVEFEKNDPRLKYFSREKPLYLFPSGFVVAPKARDLVQLLNTSIDVLRANGVLRQVDQRHNPTGELWFLSVPTSVQQATVE